MTSAYRATAAPRCRGFDGRRQTGDPLSPASIVAARAVAVSLGWKQMCFTWNTVFLRDGM